MFRGVGVARRAYAVRPGPVALLDAANGDRSIAVHDAGVGGTWKGVQGDPGATLTHTGADVFWHGGGTDPTYSQSNAILAQYRLALQNRANQFGPPPYANCP